MCRARVGARCALVFVIAVLAFPTLALPQEVSNELADASIENLMGMHVTSVSRRQEELRSTSAAVYVITSDDIRRSGITDIAELFRMVPGMNVAQSNSSTWAISARGFNSLYSTKLLVTVDGRSVYDPSFSGVFWGLQGLVLEDIERIEVIRGPGATMWGANAVNGVITITTKKASDTVGGLFVADVGQGKPGEGTFRFGQAIGKNLFYRISVRQTTRSRLLTSAGQNGGDSWNSTNMESRIDWKSNSKNSFTFEFGSYRGVAGSTQNILMSESPITFGQAGILSTRGNHAIGTWTRTLSSSSNLKLQMYYDENNRDGWGKKDTDTADFDLQHDFRIGKRQSIMWGLGHRAIRNVVSDTLSLGLTPPLSRTHLTSAFVQDDISALAGKIIFSIGTKIEDSSLAGKNVQPSIHVLWLPTSRQSFWGAASRAIRSTNVAERAVHFSSSAFDTGFGTGLVEVLGQAGAQSEELMAYDAGYRYQAGRKLWFDIATFYNSYRNLSTTNPGAPFFDTRRLFLIAPVYYGNEMNGETYGAEVSANYRANSTFTLRAGYSLLRMQLHADPGTSEPVQNPEGQSPRHQVQIESILNMPMSFEVTSHAYFVSSLPDYRVPSYTRFDTNVTWKGLRRADLSLIGQNLQGSHVEFGDSPTVSNVISRSIFGRVTWRF